MPESAETVGENLGEVLRGDKIMNSLYDIKTGVEESCKVLCRKQLTLDEAAVKAAGDLGRVWFDAPHEAHRSLLQCRKELAQRAAKTSEHCRRTVMSPASTASRSCAPSR